MISVIYPIGAGSKWQNNELRYSLRSLSKISGIGDVFIVGEKPAWVQNVIHIPCKDIPFRKEYSIYTKIMAAVEDRRVSNCFLFMNDDHFCLQDMDVTEIENYASGTLEDEYNRRHGHYKAACKNTMDLLDKITEKPHDWAGRSEYGDYHYCDVHTPILYWKGFWNGINRYMYNRSPEYVLKSLYAGFAGIQTVEITDLKINKPMQYREIIAKLADRKFFSIGDYGVCPDMKRVMSELYPKKSKYDI